MDLEKFLDIDDDTLYKFYNDLISEDTLFNTKVGKLFASGLVHSASMSNNCIANAYATSPLNHAGLPLGIYL